MTFKFDTSGFINMGVAYNSIPNSDGIVWMQWTDLAPETLARIMEDCGRAGKLPYPCGPYTRGDWFWDDRQAGRLGQHFPPLTPYIGDDGKVYLTEK